MSRGQTYEYDAENRLDRVRDAGGASLLKILPWADGTMRYSADSVVHRYYYDGDQEILETDNAGGAQLANNNIIRRYIRLPGPRAKARIRKFDRLRGRAMKCC